MIYVSIWIISGLISVILLHNTEKGKACIEKFREYCPPIPEAGFQASFLIVYTITGLLGLLMILYDLLFKSKEEILDELEKGMEE